MRFLQGKRCLHTLGRCRWRRCARGAWLSRLVCSLASAGNVCLAKPNHGFFECQQPDAKFFRMRRHQGVGEQRKVCPHHRAIVARYGTNTASMMRESKHWCCTQSLWRKNSHTMQMQRRQAPHCPHVSVRARHRRSRIRACFAAHKPACAKNARTCAASRTLRVGKRRHCASKKTRDVTAAGLRTTCVESRQCSSSSSASA